MRSLGAGDFVGVWRISREIDDRKSKLRGELEGEAELTSRADGRLDYHEVGELRLGENAPVEASRGYRWAFEGEKVAVSFTDGRDFHAFVPAGHAKGTDHPCGSDLYRVEYDFTLWPEWRAIWTVKGPRKDYTSVTVYTRG
ncbi:MAG: DUF6314 family protein [Marivivens sp.]|jgi:hypothetical protein